MPNSSAPHLDGAPQTSDTPAAETTASNPEESISTMKTRLSEARQTFQQSIASSAATFGEQIITLEHRLATAQDEAIQASRTRAELLEETRRVLQAQLEEKHATSEGLQRDLHAKEEALKQLEKELDSQKARAGRAEEEFATFQNQVQKSGQGLQALQTDLQAKDARILRLEQEATNLRNDLLQAEKLRATHTEAIKTSSATINSLNDALSVLSSKMNQLSKDATTALQREDLIKKLGHTVDQRNVQIDDLNSKIAELNSKNSGTDAALQQSSSTQQELQTTITQLRSQVSTAQAETERIQSANQELHNTLTQLRLHLASAQAETKQTAAARDGLDGTVTDLRSQLQEAQTRCQEATASASALREKNAELADKLRQAEEEAEAFEACTGQDAAARKELRMKVWKLEKENERLRSGSSMLGQEGESPLVGQSAKHGSGDAAESAAKKRRRLIFTPPNSRSPATVTPRKRQASRAHELRSSPLPGGMDDGDEQIARSTTGDRIQPSFDSIFVHQNHEKRDPEAAYPIDDTDVSEEIRATIRNVRTRYCNKLTEARYINRKQEYCVVRLCKSQKGCSNLKEEPVACDECVQNHWPCLQGWPKMTPDKRQWFLMPLPADLREGVDSSSLAYYVLPEAGH